MTHIIICFCKSGCQSLFASANVLLLNTQTMRYPGQTLRYPGQTLGYPGQTLRYPGQTLRYPGQTLRYPGQTLRYPGYGFACQNRTLNLPFLQDGPHCSSNDHSTIWCISVCGRMMQHSTNYPESSSTCFLSVSRVIAKQHAGYQYCILTTPIILLTIENRVMLEDTAVGHKLLLSKRQTFKT